MVLEAPSKPPQFMLVWSNEMDRPIVAPYSRARQNQKRAATLAGTNYCSRCDSYKPVSAFRKDRKSKNGLAHHCRECARIYEARYEPAKSAQNRKLNYGLTEEDYQERKEKQGGVCAIC